MKKIVSVLVAAAFAVAAFAQIDNAAPAAAVKKEASADVAGKASTDGEILRAPTATKKSRTEVAEQATPASATAPTAKKPATKKAVAKAPVAKDMCCDTKGAKTPAAPKSPKSSVATPAPLAPAKSLDLQAK
jgi:hypothetical protein